MSDKQEFETLSRQVVQWAKDRNLFEDAEPEKQLEKTQEELTETRDAYIKFKVLKDLEDVMDYQELSDSIDEAKSEIEDGLGDVLVTLIIFAEMANLTCVDSLKTAYDVIKHRKGRKINGKFVKEEDL